MKAQAYHKMKSSPLSVQPLVRASRMALVCALHSLFYITDIRRRTGRFTRKKQFKGGACSFECMMTTDILLYA